MTAKKSTRGVKATSESTAFAEKILLCFENYGRLTAQQVYELVDNGEYKISRVRQRICRLVAEGALHSELVPGIDSPLMAIYALGPGEEKDDAKEFKQRIVRKWKPDGKADPLALPFAFFKSAS